MAAFAAWGWGDKGRGASPASPGANRPPRRASFFLVGSGAADRRRRDHTADRLQPTPTPTKTPRWRRLHIPRAVSRTRAASLSHPHPCVHRAPKPPTLPVWLHPPPQTTPSPLLPRRPWHIPLPHPPHHTYIYEPLESDPLLTPPPPPASPLPRPRLHPSDTVLPGYSSAATRVRGEQSRVRIVSRTTQDRAPRAAIPAICRVTRQRGYHGNHRPARKARSTAPPW